MTRPKLLRVQFRAATAHEAAALARAWIDAEPNLELVRFRGTDRAYPDGPVWTGLWACTLEVLVTNTLSLGLVP
jgi:hypothetical protein